MRKVNEGYDIRSEDNSIVNFEVGDECGAIGTSGMCDGKEVEGFFKVDRRFGKETPVLLNSKYGIVSIRESSLTIIRSVNEVLEANGHKKRKIIKAYKAGPKTLELIEKHKKEEVVRLGLLENKRKSDGEAKRLELIKERAEYTIGSDTYLDKIFGNEAAAWARRLHDY